MQIKQIVDQVFDEARGAWRFRWAGVAAAWVVCIAGWIGVYTLPLSYEANARVYVDTKSILRPLLQGLAIDPDVASGLDLVRQVLLSRPQIEQVARATDLDAAAKTPEARERLIADIQSRITIEAADLRARTTDGAGLYRIKFKDASHEKSVEVVQKLLTAFVENALGEKRTGQETAERFIEDQIAEYERRLRDAETRLAEFKKTNVGVMPDTQGDYFARLQQESGGLETVRQNLAIAVSRRTEIARQLSGEDPYLFGFDGGGAPAAERGGDITYRIQDLEKQLEELLLRFTEKHPEVEATRQTIQELQRRQAEELARVRSGAQASGSMASSLKSNPVYQNLELELKRTDVQIAELRQELAQRQGKVSMLKQRVDSVPEVEAELARLNRDYDVTRQKYLELVQRRETANLSKDADRTGTVKFEVIDPPAAPLEPISPNRPVLLAMVLLAGLGVAAVVSWLLNQLRPVFHSVTSLAEITGRPVIAAVSRTWLDRHREQRRRELLKFGTAAAMLLVGFGIVIILPRFGV